MQGRSQKKLLKGQLSLKILDYSFFPPGELLFSSCLAYTIFAKFLKCAAFLHSVCMALQLVAEGFSSYREGTTSAVADYVSLNE